MFNLEKNNLISSSKKIESDNIDDTLESLSNNEDIPKQENILGKIRNYSKLNKSAILGLAFGAVAGLEAYKEINKDKEIDKDKELTSEVKYFLKDCNSKYGQPESDLAVENEAKERIFFLRNLLDKAKSEVLEHIQGEEYLNKLVVEFDVSLVKAKKIQDRRVSEVKKLVCNFKSSEEIAEDVEGALAYYTPGEGIVVPYDVELGVKSSVEKLYNAMKHEILHASTVADYMLSDKAFKIFKKSFNQNHQKYNKYLSDPTELMVRKQMLDLEMEKLGIKKYGEKFTKEHFYELWLLKGRGKLSSNIEDLLYNIKSENFLEMMNELADAQIDNKTYSHPGWDYNSEDNNDNQA